MFGWKVVEIQIDGWLHVHFVSLLRRLITAVRDAGGVLQSQPTYSVIHMTTAQSERSLSRAIATDQLAVRRLVLHSRAQHMDISAMERLTLAVDGRHYSGNVVRFVYVLFVLL